MVHIFLTRQIKTITIGVFGIILVLIVGFLVYCVHFDLPVIPVFDLVSVIPVFLFLLLPRPFTPDPRLSAQVFVVLVR